MIDRLATDLRERWHPTDTAVKLANAILADEATGAWNPEGTGTGVYTIHLLVNKEHGFWTDDVEVIALDGVFTDRMAAWHALNDAARRHHEKTGTKVSGGYAWHPRPDEWAVFEDIGTIFPVPEWKTRRRNEKEA